ncbi:hypothetical protein ASD24_05465 [Paenibacillus sp. Root52]|uniref:hypothetical protein n=1 Tax=Paenibacillus sp. Root52 TaxID=1736552 RepID=UPI000700D183|nr:hypothetical protein [Paenibacillus sp. Root52]KQY87310.1 hypothetical protein ASD24_05465 [Paenibacillus sp. Root52]
MRHDWFQVMQDTRVTGAIEPMGVKGIIQPEWMRGKQLNELEQSNLQFTIRPNRRPVAVDLIERPYPLWSDELKRLLHTFAPRLMFRLVGLMDMERQQLHPYWFMVPPRLNALSRSSTFDNSGKLNVLQVDADQLSSTSWPIIYVADERLQETVMLVNLALAEAILRREFTGLRLQRVNQVEGENRLLSL